MRVVLTIAGFDPSGGAGTLADIKTIAAFGCFGVAAITALTAQDTRAVYGAYPQPVDVVRAQLAPLVEDFDIAAVKLGMLPNRAIIEMVAEFLTTRALSNVVLDPVIRSTSGYDLIDEAALVALVEHLLPLAAVVTPNLPEAERLTGLTVRNLDQMQSAAQHIRRQAPSSAVLIKGGHLQDGANEAIDWLDDGHAGRLFRAPKIATHNTHGTGCTLSSAIAARLALGDDLPAAVQQAKDYVSAAIHCAPGLGHGAGPLHHWFKLEQN